MAKPPKTNPQLGLFGASSPQRPQRRTARGPKPVPGPEDVASGRPRSMQAPQENPSNGREPSQEDRAPELDVVSVAQLDRLLKRVVENATQSVQVRGEIGSCHRAGSGHIYFTLKDEKEAATIDGVMYRSAPKRARDMLQDGASVVMVGRATVYAPRGRLQLVANDVLVEGRGALLLALEERKRRLQAEGLFDASRKRPLPTNPRCVAVVTSKHGAAVHDVIRVAFRRSRLRLLVVDTPVQGALAPAGIVAAIAKANRLAHVDALIVTRGGGSLEDLAAFNEESVVRAIADSKIPVVCAIGHEVDLCLAELAADHRAATPSQAAELLVPDDRAQRERLHHQKQRLARAVRLQLSMHAKSLHEARSRLGEPRRRLLEMSQYFDELRLRLERLQRGELKKRGQALTQLGERLNRSDPRHVLSQAQAHLTSMVPKLAAAMARQLHARQRRLGPLPLRRDNAILQQLKLARAQLGTRAEQLQALSPLSVLGRGYAIVRDGNKLVRRAEPSLLGRELNIRLGQGTLSATVQRVDEAEPSDS